MKIQTGFYLGVSTVEELRKRAQETGAGLSDLTDLLLRLSLAKVTNEAIVAWVASQEVKKGRLGGGMTKHERQVLGAIAALKAKYSPSWQFENSDVAQAAGLKLRESYWALQGLQARGITSGASPNDEVDRWGRPLKSFWCLVVDRAAVDVKFAASLRAAQIPDSV